VYRGWGGWCRACISLFVLTLPTDNGDVIDMIDDRRSGLLALLDSACRQPGGSDVTFTATLWEGLKRGQRVLPDAVIPNGALVIC